MKYRPGQIEATVDALLLLGRLRRQGPEGWLQLFGAQSALARQACDGEDRTLAWSMILTLADEVVALREQIGQ